MTSVARGSGIVPGEPSAARRLLAGSGAVFLVLAGGKALAFLSQVQLARLAGKESYGVYAAAMVWVSLLALLARLGLDTAALRFVPAYLATGRDGLARGFMAASLKAVLLAAVLLGAGLAASAWACGSSVEVIAAFLVAGILVPASCWAQMLAAFLRALERPVASLLLLSAVHPAFVMLGAAAVFLTSGSLGAPAMAWTCLGAFAVVIAVGGIFLRGSPAGGGGKPEAETRLWLSTAFPLFLISLWQLLLSQADQLMIGPLLGTGELGVYRAASCIAALCTFGVEVADFLAAPAIARLHATADKRGLQAASVRACRLALAVALPVFAVMVLGGRWILGLFGPGFDAAYGPLVILAAGNLAMAGAGPVGYLMTMTGRQTQAAVLIGASALLVIVLCAVLIPIWGTTGAALATAAGCAIRQVLAAVFVYRDMGIRPGFW